MHKLFNLNLIN